MTRSQFTTLQGIAHRIPASASASVLILVIYSGLLAQPKIWINEFHYDNAEGDIDEFVEIMAPVSFSSHDKVSLTLYNGSKGEPYGSVHTLDTFTQGAQIDSFRIYYKTITGLQNNMLSLSLNFGDDQKCTVIKTRTQPLRGSLSSAPSLAFFSNLF